MNTFIQKCACCETRILFIRGELVHGDFCSNQLIPVADLSLDDLTNLSKQISEILK